METKEGFMKVGAKNMKNQSVGLMGALLIFAIVSIAGCSAKKAAVETPAQTKFATAAEAGQALQNAARAGDESTLARILGPNSKAILSSGDSAEDKALIQFFVSKYDQMNRWVAMTDGSQILNIGADNYPFPIPLVKDSSSRWYFNTEAGQDEILARQIGKNELLAIDATSSIGNAEELYFQKAHDGNPAHLYTTKILSTPGKQDGLFWEVPAGQVSSPLGRVNDFAKRAVESAATTDRVVFDGYVFRILDAQGSQAKGGPKNYVVNGKMNGGWAVIASPVKYHDSGMKTFMLSREGVVYEKDLGQDTSAAAAAIKDYNPVDGWTAVEDAE
jgi:hypothetical protein